ncbi:MAG: DUF3343 domain-containing protein [Clostridia bacterium]|nr:DUF3343 domain-containing protein [Clostridia bacterium]
MKYLATFHTHFASQSFNRSLPSHGVKGRMMPVPRSLSSSCGTCVQFETDGDFMPLLVEDTEKVYRVEEDGSYTCIYKHQDD